MAASAISELRGFDKSLLEKLSEEKKNAIDAACKEEGLICIKCNEVPYTPVRPLVCAHTFCKICLEKSIQEKEKCLGCHKDLPAKLILRRSIINRIQQIYDENVAQTKQVVFRGSEYCQKLFPNKEPTVRELQDLSTLVAQFKLCISKEIIIDRRGKPITFNTKLEAPLSKKTEELFSRILHKNHFEIESYCFETNEITVKLTKEGVEKHIPKCELSYDTIVSQLNQRDVNKFKLLLTEVESLLKNKNSHLYLGLSVTLEQRIPRSMIDHVNKYITFCKVYWKSKSTDEVEITLVPPDLQEDVVAEKVKHYKSKLIKARDQFQVKYKEYYDDFVARFDRAIQKPEVIQSLISRNDLWVPIEINNFLWRNIRIRKDVVKYIENRGFKFDYGETSSLKIRLKPCNKALTTPFQYPNKSVMEYAIKYIRKFNKFLNSYYETIDDKFKYEIALSCGKFSEEKKQALLLFCNHLHNNGYRIKDFCNQPSDVNSRIKSGFFHKEKFIVVLSVENPPESSKLTSLSTSWSKRILTQLKTYEEKTISHSVDKLVNQEIEVESSKDDIRLKVTEENLKSLGALLSSCFGEKDSDWKRTDDGISIVIPYAPSQEVKTKVSEMQAELKLASENLTKSESLLFEKVQDLFLSQIGKKALVLPFTPPQYMISEVSKQINAIEEVSFKSVSNRVFKLTTTHEVEVEHDYPNLKDLLRKHEKGINYNDLKIIKHVFNTIAQLIEKDFRSDRLMLKGESISCYFPELNKGTERIFNEIKTIFRSYGYHVWFKESFLVVQGVFG